MSRIARRFEALRAEGRAALVAYVSAGDPDFETSLDILRRLPGAGADAIEIGVPFTDPMADGPVIQAAALRALEAGMTLPRCLELVRRFRGDDPETAVLLMGYFNPIHRYGPERFARDAREAGVDGLITVDLPPEEEAELADPARAAGLDIVRLAAPTTGEARLGEILKGASGFVYYVSIAGITGTRAPTMEEVEEAVAGLRRATDLPIAVGFGISTPEQAAEVARFADAAVVGTALVREIEAGREGAPERVEALARRLADGVRGSAKVNWLTDFVPPRLRNLVRRNRVPQDLWLQCDKCEQMLFRRDFEESAHVCIHCGHHMSLDAPARLALLFDEGDYETIETPAATVDPLRFRDLRRYSERLRDARSKTDRKGAGDAMTVAHGRIGGRPAVVAILDFAFMGGSMGIGVGEAFLAAARLAIDQDAAFIAVTASGGARMQEGILSLMQMPRTTIAVAEVKEAGLPYIVLLTNPTTGGVSASYAMLGDIAIAEPGAMIGFAGQRVIRETIRETLPDDFQSAEYLLDHGIIDMVVHRRELKDRLGALLGLLMEPDGGPAHPGSAPAGLDIPEPPAEPGEAGAD